MNPGCGKSGNVTIEMPRYISHKRVWALQIEKVVDQGTDTTTYEGQIIEVHFKDSRYAPRCINIGHKPIPEAGWYFVSYTDGYTSFSPAKQFEEGNTLESVSFKDRVVAEKNELSEKLTKLNSFIGGDNFNNLPSDERVRLARQAEAMKNYLDILNERILTF